MPTVTTLSINSSRVTPQGDPRENILANQKATCDKLGGTFRFNPPNSDDKWSICKQITKPSLIAGIVGSWNYSDHYDIYKVNKIFASSGKLPIPVIVEPVEIEDKVFDQWRSANANRIVRTNFSTYSWALSLK